MNDLSQYAAARARMRPGDQVALAGSSLVSRAIGLFSGRSWNPKVANLSHVLTVHTSMDTGTLRVLVTHSTMQNGKSGPQAAYLSDVLADYQGQGWFCPLSDPIREVANWTEFEAFIKASEGHATYPIPDLFGFLLRDLPIVGTRVAQSQHSSGMVCSAYDTAILKAAGIVRGVNYSQVSPQQLLEMAIYAPGPPVQLIGKPGCFAAYNTI
jgi:hypothetical protein